LKVKMERKWKNKKKDKLDKTEKNMTR